MACNGKMFGEPAGLVRRGSQIEMTTRDEPPSSPVTKMRVARVRALERKIHLPRVTVPRRATEMRMRSG